MSAKSRQATLWFLLVLAVAIAVRLWHLTTWDLWTDEWHTLLLAQSGVYREGPEYSTAPLNFILTRWAISIFGVGELAGRIVPLVAGLLTVALVYLLGRTWVGKRAALLGSAVVALSTWHVYWSQTARHFSLETLAVLLAVHCFLLYWRHEKWIGLVGTPLFLLMAMFTHASGAFYLAALGVFVVGSWLRGRLVAADPALRKRHLMMLGALTVAGAVYFPIYLWLGRYLLNSAPAWNPLWNLLGSFAFYLPAWLSLAGVAGAAFLAYERDDLAALLLGLVVIPIALLAAASRFTIASNPYCLASLPAVALLVGVAGDRLLAMGQANGRVWAAALLVSGIFCAETADLALYHTAYHGFKPRWRDVAGFLRKHRAPGELVIAEEGDVLQFYLGSGQIGWYDHYQTMIGTPAMPCDGVHGTWYAIYEFDHLMGQEERARDYIVREAKLEELFPLNYGPKDRTIGLYYEPPSACATSAPTPAPHARR